MANKVSSKFVDPVNGVEYYENYFIIRSEFDLTTEERNKISLGIRESLMKIQAEKNVPSNNSDT